MMKPDFLGSSVFLSGRLDLLGGSKSLLGGKESLLDAAVCIYSAVS